MWISQFAFVLLLGISGNLIRAQLAQGQDDRISKAFDIGFLAMAPKVMCADTIETIFITLTNMTRNIEVMVQIIDGPDPEDVITKTPIKLVGTPCACLEIRIPPIKESRRVVSLQLLSRRTDLQCEDFEVTVQKKVFIDACEAETFIETDKPVYIAGQTVKFRVLTLKTDLRPDPNPVCRIWIEDPNTIPMIEWKDVQGQDGLIELEMSLCKETPIGEWTIRLIHYGRTFTLTFQVEKYETPRFELVIQKPAFITVNTQTMNLKICARYPVGQAVPGSIGVILSIQNAAYKKATSKNRRAVIKMKEEDTGLNGCYDAVVDLDKFELCSDQYTLANARMRMTVEYTDAATEFTVKLVDKETLVVKEPYTITFDALPVFKPGLPYHGRVIVRYPDETPATNIQVTVRALGEEYSVYDETLTSNGEGIINFLLPEIMYEVKSFTLTASGVYESGAACQGPNSFEIAAPEASLYVEQQYSPSGSYIKVLPITDRVKINSLQSISMYFVTQEPEATGINFHLMFMSRGNILRSTEVFIYREDYDGFKHPGTFLPIPLSEHEPHTEKDFAEPHIGPIDTPVSLLTKGQLKVTHRKFKITAAMSPLTSVIVYYVRKDNEVVSDMIDFTVEEVFDNKVKMNFVKPKEAPRSSTKLKIKAAPGSLCAYGVVDRVIHMMGEQNRITKKRVFNALARMQLSAQGGYADDNDRCGDIYQLPVQAGVGQEERMRLIGAIPQGFVQNPGFSPIQLDGSITFRNMGIVYLTNLAVETKPCPKYNKEDLERGPTIYGNEEKFITKAVDTVVDVPGKSLRIKSFFPETWLWEIKRTSDDTGETNVKVSVPDRITTWIGRGFCTSALHGAGVSDLFPLTVYQVFYLVLSLPTAVIRGEKVAIKVKVVDTLQECLVIKLSLKQSADYTSSEIDPEKTVCVCNGMPASAEFYIIPNVIGSIPIEVYGVALEDDIENSVCGDDPVDMLQAGLTDSVKEPLVVEARGITVEQVFSTYFCPADYSDDTYEERVLLRELPANVVPGSVSSTFTVTGDLIAPTLVNLGTLLHLPLISGEQNLLNFAPNVFILRYLKLTHQLTPQIEKQAIANMLVGYQCQSTFRRKDGSYVMFRNDLRGSSWLTAYVVRVFAFASQHMAVDLSDLKASIEWLTSLQDAESGCFTPTGRIIHSALKGVKGDEVTHTAYILAAMMEAGISPRDPSIKKGMECLDLALNGLHDPYTAAIMAYTFALAQQPCIDKAIAILNDMAIFEPGTVHWETERSDIPVDNDPYLHHKAAAQDIELTSYVLLAYTIYKESSYVVISANKISRWIVHQLNDIGGYASSQDTMVATQALAEYARVSRIVRGRTDIDINVHFLCDKTPHNLVVNEENRLQLQQLPIPLIPVDIIVEATGNACAMTQVIVKYNVIPAESPKGNFIMTYKSESVDNNCDIQNMKICIVYSGRKKVSNLAVVNIKLVSGYSANEKSLDNLKVSGLKDGLRTVESNGNIVTVMYDKFSMKRKCFEVKVKKEFDIRDTKRGIITVYDYYEPARTVSTLYDFGCGTEAKNDAHDPKPGNCPILDLSSHACIHMCEEDSSCDGLHKCCTSGCVSMCMLPKGVERIDPEEKYGHCPLIEFATKKLGLKQCASDDDCFGVEKCCNEPKGGTLCKVPSELNHCPSCLAGLPDESADVICKYDYVVSAKLLDNGKVRISRDLKTNKGIRGISDVHVIMDNRCDCKVLTTRSLLMLRFNKADLDLDKKTLSLRGNTLVLRLTTALKEEVKELPTLCDASVLAKKQALASKQKAAVRAKMAFQASKAGPKK